VLGEHPETFLPDFKEINLFRGWGRPSRYERYGRQVYASIYAGTEGYRARGDISRGLLAGPSAPEQLHRCAPDCRLIVVLRDPAERAHSHYLFAAGRSHVRYSLEDLVAGRVRHDPHEILVEGFYSRHLRNYLRYYARERILILLYDDLVNDPWKYYRTVCRFIGVDDSFRPRSINTRANPPAHHRIAKLYEWNRDLATFLMLNGLDPVRRAIKWLGVPQLLLRRWNTTTLPKVPLDPGTRRALVELYREDVVELEGLLGRDLSAWREVEVASGANGRAASRCE
jgi:hypothetical protein